jgi:hypothetical protein
MLFFSNKTSWSKVTRRINVIKGTGIIMDGGIIVPIIFPVFSNQK